MKLDLPDTQAVIEEQATARDRYDDQRAYEADDGHAKMLHYGEIHDRCHKGNYPEPKQEFSKPEDDSGEQDHHVEHDDDDKSDQAEQEAERKAAEPNGKTARQ